MFAHWIVSSCMLLSIVLSQSDLSSNASEAEDYSGYEYDYYSSYEYGYYGYEIPDITFENEWGEEKGLFIAPDWTNWNVDREDGSGIFSCFNATERARYREIFQVTETELHLNGKTRFFSDNWGFGSLAVDIILQEIFGFQINMSLLYVSVIPMMENSWQFPAETGFQIPFFHLELWASDFTFWNLYRYASPEVDISLIGTPFFWVIMVREDTLAEVEAEIGDDTTFLDVWRTYLDPVVVAAMASPEDIDNLGGAPCNDDQTAFANCFNVDISVVSEYTGVEGGMLVNGTYYPPQCPVGDASDCMVLISFLPDYSMHLHADLIAQYDLKWVVKYIGGEWSSDTLELFQHLYENKRVLFEIYQPTVFGAGDWRFISMPVTHPFAQQDQIFGGVSSRMAFVSRFAHNLISSGFIMGTDDYKIMNEYIRNATGIYDPDHLPISCRWLKEHESSWSSWIDLEQKPQTEDLCERVSDATLQKLLEFRALSDLELEGVVMEQGNDLFRTLDSSMEDLYSIQYAMTQCITSQDDSDSQLHLLTVILAVIGFVMMIIALICIVSKRKEPIIKSSSFVMLMTLVSGGCMGLVYPFLNDTSVLSNCYMQPVIFQMSLTIICGAISFKTWRLSYYIKMANECKKPKTITDLNLVIRLGCVMTAVGTYLLVLFLVYPMETEGIVFEAEIFEVCKQEAAFKNCYLGLLLLECVQLAVVGQSVWSLRSLSTQFNESKWISVIMYHCCMFIVALIVLDQNIIEMNPDQIYFAKSIVVELFVFVSVFGLLIPKFVLIAKDVKFSGDIVAKDMIHIDTNAMTKDDVKKIKRLVSKFGYDLKKRGSVNLSHTDLFESTKGSVSRSFKGSVTRLFKRSVSQSQQFKRSVSDVSQSSVSARFVSQDTAEIELQVHNDEVRMKSQRPEEGKGEKN